MILRFSALIFASLLPAFALADSPSFNLDRLRLNPGGETLLLGTGDGLQRGQLRLGLGTQYQHEPLLYSEGDGTVRALIGYRLSAHLAAAYGITDWFEAGLEVPMILTQGGDSIPGVDPIQGTVAGAPQIQGRFTFLREAQGASLDLGLTLGLSFPLGAEDGLSRDPGGGLAFNPRVGAGKRLGSALRLGAEAGLLIREEAALSPYSIDPEDEVGNELDLGVVASSLGEGLRGELMLLGHLPLSDAPASAELLAGARYPFRALGLEAFALAGPGLGGTPGTPLFRVFAGVAYAPAAPPAAPACEADRSCPHLDKDGDGVANQVDACPTEAGPASLDGCPDDDGDGVPNGDDRCPQDPGSVDNEGCPPLDSDGDGIADNEDHCPLEAGAAAHDGCAPPDADGDGIIDDDDRCPDLAGAALHDGCPESAAEAFTEGEAITIDQHLRFAIDDYQPQGASLEILSQVAATLRANPGIRKVRIEGHSDALGSRELNLSLSQARADAVKAYLVSQGVEADRLEAIGIGPDRPIADNTTSAGREQNRRVEFFIVRDAL